MYLRTAPEKTLTDILNEIESADTVSTSAMWSEVRVDVTAAEPTVSIRDTEVPLAKDGLDALAVGLDVPAAFLRRQPSDFQQIVLDNLLSRARGAASFSYSPTSGLRDIVDNASRVIPIARLLHTAARVIDPTAPVDSFISTPKEFRLDVFAPEGFSRGHGGDIAVGDLSAAGIRMTQDRKANLAPQVIPFNYRFVCTNGMTMLEQGLAVDARGESVEDVLAQFETMADQAFRRAEAGIESFYDLREQRVDNPERTIARIAQEAGIPARTIASLIERAPVLADEAEHQGRFVSMFDVANLFTNEANRGSLRSGPRMALQSVGGGIVTSHVERCSHCQSKLVES